MLENDPQLIAEIPALDLRQSIQYVGKARRPKANVPYTHRADMAHFHLMMGGRWGHNFALEASDGHRLHRAEINRAVVIIDLSIVLLADDMISLANSLRGVIGRVKMYQSPTGQLVFAWGTGVRFVRPYGHEWKHESWRIVPNRLHAKAQINARQWKGLIKSMAWVKEADVTIDSQTITRIAGRPTRGDAEVCEGLVAEWNRRGGLPVGFRVKRRYMADALPSQWARAELSGGKDHEAWYITCAPRKGFELMAAVMPILK